MAKNQIIIHGGYYPALTEKVGQRFKYSQKGKTAVAGITPDAFRGLKETDTSYLDSYTITKKGLGAFNLPEMYLGAQIPIAEGVTVAHLQAFKKIVGGFDVFRKVRLTDVQKMKPNLEKFHGKANKFLLRGNYVWYSARETTGAAMASLLQGKYSNFNFTEAEREYQSFVGKVKSKQIVGWAKQMFPKSFAGKVEVSEDIINQKAKDAAEEMLMGSQVEPAKALGTARRPDIETVIKGRKVVLESTEEGGLADHHELPKKNTSGIEYGEYDKVNEKNHAEIQEKFRKYMAGTVLKDLNKYIKAIRNRRTDKAKKLGTAPVAGVSYARGTSTAEIRRDAARKTKSAVQRKVIENMTKGQAHWVNHTLANITGNIGKEYRSGIPITKVDPQTGERWYGSTPIVHLPNFEYDVNAAKEAVVISGLSHLHALLKQRDTAAAEKEAQNHVLKHATFGMHQAHRNRSARVANNLVQSAGSYSISNAFSRPLTVSFSPKIAKKLIDECLEVIHKDLEKGIIEEGKNRRNDVLAARNKNIQSNIFWALPYIGIEEQQYREKKS